MSKAKTTTTTTTRTTTRPAAKPVAPVASGKADPSTIEKPLPAEDQLKTAAEERLESTDQTLRADGTTPRHTEPLGPPAPGQQGRPGPERRVRNNNVVNAPQGDVPDTPEGLAAYKASLGPKMRVRATQTGYIDHVRRRAGDVFDIRRDEFSHKWMETVDGSTPPKVSTAASSLKAHHDSVISDRSAARGGAPARSTGDNDVLG